MLETVFAFLFKYPIRVYERGDLVLGAGWPPAVVAARALAAFVLVAAAYRRVRASGRRDRVVPVVLRGAALAVVAVCLLRPALVLSSSIAQRNVLGILLDDSRSMRVAD